MAALLLVTATAACGDDDLPPVTPAATGGATLTVFAAASLTSSFEQIGESFEESHDGVQVEFNFAGSSDLVAQIQSGAPADVFASADEANMEKLTADDLQGSDPELFATNTLEIAVPPDNPAGVQSLEDLAEPRHQPGHLCAGGAVRRRRPVRRRGRRGRPSSRSARSSR